MKRPLIVLALALFGVASAQEAGGVLETILNVDTWVQALSTYADTYETAFERISDALVAAGFIASVIGVLARGSLGGMNDTFFRLFLATGLIALTPAITTLSVDTWKGLRSWSGGEMQASFQDGAAEMEQLGNDAGILAIAATGAASSLLRVSGMGAAQAAGQARAGTAVKMLNATVIPVAMIGLIANFIILGSGIAVFIACAFLPIAAGMLAFSPMQGGEWIGRVVGAVVSALVVTAFMPLVFKAAFDITVVQPVQAVNAEFAEFSDFYDPDALAPPPRLAEIQSVRETLLTERGELTEGTSVWERVRDSPRVAWIDNRLTNLAVESTAVQAMWMKKALGDLNNAYDAIANQVTRWGVRLLIMFVGAFMAVGLTWWGARAATGLVGGVVGGKIGALAVGGVGGLFGAGGGGSDRKNDRSSSAHNDSSDSQGKGSGDKVTRNNGVGPSPGGGRNDGGVATDAL